VISRSTDCPQRLAAQAEGLAEARRDIPRWKRGLDLACILAAAPLVVPLGLLIALMVKLVSPGPALFRQQRVGYRGRRFLCLKFRTMAVNADTGVHAGHMVHLMKSNCPMAKLDAAGDPRLIVGGRLLRSSGLDELPQLINVLRGEMSLVGSRPCLAYECENYQPRHWQRFETPPGLTGFWQVNGKNRTTFEEMIDLDLYYVKHRSLLLDLSIIARTIPAIVQQVIDQRRKEKPAPCAQRSGTAGPRYSIASPEMEDGNKDLY
jgi:lipopolysaccharide/colanic/teichoic acid biosynthesis glycosyltransferase